MKWRISVTKLDYFFSSAHPMCAMAGLGQHPLRSQLSHTAEANKMLERKKWTAQQ